MIKGLAVTDGVDIANDIDALSASLKRLLFVGIGESLGNLERGSRIPEYLDEPQTMQTANGIINEVVMLIQAFEKRINLQSVGVLFTDDRGIVIQIEFYWIGDNDKTDLQSLSLSN